MKLFAELYFALDTTNDLDVRVRALSHYLRQAPPEDVIPALRLLLGTRPRRILPLEELNELAFEAANVPLWLFEESLTAVKDKLEAVTLLLPPPEAPDERPLREWLSERLPALRNAELKERNAKIRSSWELMDFQERFVWNKLLSGGFRLQLPDRVIVRALSEVSGLDACVLAYRLKYLYESAPNAYDNLLAPDAADAAASRPYPFPPEQSLDLQTIHLTEQSQMKHWHIEWNWDGLRVQCIKRQGQFFLWSQKIELLTDKFPELQKFGECLPDGTVIEAQLVAWQHDSALPIEKLHTRVRRKQLSKKLLQEAPLRVFAFDVLEDRGQDIRQQPFSQRRSRLSELLGGEPPSLVHISPDVEAACWAELDAIAEQSRKRGAAGFLLTPIDLPEEKCEDIGGWWKWKAKPLTLFGILLYVQRRQGPSLQPVTEYSVGVLDGDGLVKIAAVNAELPQGELEEIDRFVKDNTIERFGPVRSVKAELVFEISFGGIRRSARHKAGLKLENPKLVCWRREKSPEDAESLNTLQGLLCE